MANRSRRAITALITGSTLALAALASAPTSQAGDAPSGEIVIAFEGPLSGSQGANGRDQLRGVRLAVQQVNARGGVLGHRVRIVPIDDQANPNLARQAVRTAKDAGAVAVIGPYNSSVGVINLPLYLNAGITPVHMTSTNQTDGMGVTVQPKNNQIAPVEIDWLSRSTGCPKVVMLVDPSDYTQGMANRVGKAMVCGDGVPVASIPIQEGLDDYSAQVTQALALDPDELYVSTYYPEGSKIAQALAAADATTSCLMGLANVDPAFVQAAGIATSKRCVFSGIPEARQLPGARAKAYVDQYRRAFDRTPGVWSPFTYDSANVLFAAMTQAGTTEFRSVLRVLQQTSDFPGVTGSITIDPKTGNDTTVKVYIMRVDDAGAYVPISE